MEWTTQQQEAIEYRNNNVLLAAAAGSGKTAVLVQRVIELIEKDKISVNELLVLTFTDAAAGEMREKIKKAISDALRNNPADEHMQRQKLLIHSSSISTVHSFCMNTLKSNIYLTGLPVDFSIVSETEASIMLREALDRVLEMFYERIDRDSSFAQLVMGYGGIKNDSALREMVLSLHNFSRSMADPARWLNGTVREYKAVAETGEFSNELWMSRQKAFVEKTKAEVQLIYDKIRQEIEENMPEAHPYVAFFADEAASLQRVFEHMNPEDYSSVKSEIDSFAFKNLARGLTTDDNEIIEARERIKSLRSLAKSSIEKLQECFVAEPEDMAQRIAKTYPMLRTLKNIVLMLDRCYTRKKRSKNFLDFNDLEHETLKLLSTKSGEGSETAEKLRGKFKAILVDEYQDTNNIQDAIFRLISGDNKNIFMVGDMKQSIYKFRNAVPRLFSDKYELYGRDDKEGHLIQLFKNFRSRTSVVDTVNFLFERIMSPDVGDISYTTDEYLDFGAKYYPKEGEKGDCNAEFHFICRDVTDADGEILESFDRNTIEAEFAVKRIQQLVESGFKVFDKEKNDLRNVRYSDIVILVRNPRSATPTIEKVFDEHGIPLYTEVGKGYLDAPEIQIALAFLQVVDNPYQDIPLIAILRTPVWDFTPEELAEIRMGKKKGYFLDALEFAAENGNQKAAEFLEKLEKWRGMAGYESVDALLCEFYYECGYYAYLGSLKHGAEKQANLRLLLEHASDFEKTKLSGLFSFVNYIETIRAEGGDMVPAKTFGEGEDVVRVMSIHKSKGLEFPVVFLMDTAHKFNFKDASQAVIWDEKAGIGAVYADADARIRYSTLPQKFVGMSIKDDQMSEEMRLLYVALTRAREKLIICSTFKVGEKTWKNPLWDEQSRVAVSYVSRASSYREWLVSAFLLHPDAKVLRELCDTPESEALTDVDFNMDFYVYNRPDEVVSEVMASGGTTVVEENDEEKLLEEVKARFNFVYPNEELERLPVKLSVSEVKRMQSEEADFVPLIEPLNDGKQAELGVVSGAERGTVVHFVMQMLKPETVNSTEDIEREILRMKNERILSDAQAASVDCDKIADFFNSDLGKRLKSARRRETEFSFYTEVPADEVLGNESKQKILIQGTVDCFFVEEDGRTVLLDYKTDRVKTEAAARNAARKYKVQMKYYKKALKDILGQDVDECYLYFMECGAFVDMNKDSFDDGEVCS